VPENELTNCIRRLRFEYGEMTQQDLADKVDVTRQIIIAIEQRSREAKDETFTKRSGK
jgi:putative transcriptional regulator